jgi:hypothetical protein
MALFWFASAFWDNVLFSELLYKYSILFENEGEGKKTNYFNGVWGREMGKIRSYIRDE